MAAEGCAPLGTSMGHGYPLPSQAEAIDASEDGDPESCGCDEPWYNQGPGCYVALSGFTAGVSPDPTANFLQVSGACSADKSSLSQNVVHPLHRTPPSLMAARTAPPPATQAWSLPTDAEMQYYFVGDRNQVGVGANGQPKCVIPDWGDVDADGADEYGYIGSKIPDECCQDAWKGSAPEPIHDSNGVQHTCFIRDAPFPGYRLTDKMRLYLGCEHGKLVSAENCVPADVTYQTAATFKDNTYEYPMKEAVAATHWKNDVPDGCGCSKRSRFNNGPGCYLAYATAYDYGMKFKNGSMPGVVPAAAGPDAGVRGAVFVRIKGECSA